MAGIASEALKDVAAAEDRVAAIQQALDHQREQFDTATKQLRNELAEQRRLIASRLREAASAYSDPTATPRRPSGGGGAKRAQRGSNKFAILSVVDERPGVSAAEVTKVTGLKSATVAASLQGLSKGEAPDVAASKDAATNRVTYKLADAGKRWLATNAGKFDA